MSIGDEALRGMGWVALSTWGSRAMSIVVLVVLARSVDPGDFGLMAVAALVMAVVAVVRDCGLVHALVQHHDPTEEHLHSTFWTTAVLAALATVVVLMGSPLIAGWLDEPSLVHVVWWLTPSLLIGALRTVPTAVLQRRMAFRSLAQRSLVGDLVGGIVGVTVALGGGGVYALVAMAVVNSAVETLIVSRAAGYRPRLVWTWRSTTELMRFGSGVAGMQMVNVGFRRGDDLVVAGALGSVALGIYSMAYRIVSMAQELFIHAITQVTLPTFARLSDERARLARAAESALHGVALVALPALVGLAVMADDLVTVLFGPDWSAAAPVMALLALGAAFSPLFGFQIQLLLSTGASAQAGALSAVNGLLGLIGVVLAAPHGLAWIGIAFALRSLLMVPISTWWSSPVTGLGAAGIVRACRIPIVLTTVMAIIVVSAAAALGAVHPAIRLVVVSSVGAAVYLVSAYRYDPSSRDLLARLRRVRELGRPMTPPLPVVGS
ncbi:MAG: lipopolysaccharide biosynthesis protein [Acidimicrobiales bacterium]